MLTAAYTLAVYAMLRPTEYTLTPRHSTFDETRHMRACDVTFYKGATRLAATSSTKPDRYTVNIKQSKADPDRIGAMPTIGATGTATCPVSAMWSYFQHIRPAPNGPLFVDSASAPLQYPSALHARATNAHRSHRAPVWPAQLPGGRRSSPSTRRQKRLLHYGPRQVENNRERFKVCGTAVRHPMPRCQSNVHHCYATELGVSTT